MPALEPFLYVFLVIIAFGTVNLLAARLVLRRRQPVSGQRLTPRTMLDVMALGHITVVLGAALLIDMLLIQPSIPVVGRPLLFVIAALISHFIRRMFALMPNTPAFMPRLLRGFEVALFVLAVVGAVLSVLVRGV
jgi:hypothetical protein